MKYTDERPTRKEEANSNNFNTDRESKKPEEINKRAYGLQTSSSQSTSNTFTQRSLLGSLTRPQAAASSSAYCLKREQYLKRQQLLTPRDNKRSFAHVSPRYMNSFTTASLSNFTSSNNYEPASPATKPILASQLLLDYQNLSVIETDAKSISDSSSDSINHFLTMKDNEIVFKDLKIDLNNNQVVDQNVLVPPKICIGDESFQTDNSFEDDRDTSLSKEDRNSFIDSFFNSSRSSASNGNRKSLKFSHQPSFDQDEINTIQPVYSESMAQKVKLLDNLVLDDRHSNSLLLKYLNTFEVLSDKRIVQFLAQKPQSVSDCTCLKNAFKCCIRNLSNMANEQVNNKDIQSALPGCCNICLGFDHSQPKLYIEKELSVRFSSVNEVKDLLFISDEISKSGLVNEIHDCDCLSTPKLLTCCIETIYEHVSGEINSDKQRLPECLIKQKCCQHCYSSSSAKIDQVPLNKIDKQSSTEKNEQPNKTDFWQSFFGFIEEDKKSQESKNEPVHELVKNSPAVISGPARLAPEAPQNKETGCKKSLLKKSHSPLNSSRKSVTFIEDPKFGFLPVEIPSWQESLREPKNPKKKATPDWQS